MHAAGDADDEPNQGAVVLRGAAMLHKILILLHLVGFAAYIGAGFAQQQFVTRSGRDGVAAAVRDEYERLAASIVTKIELPALFGQVVTGILFIAITPQWLTQGWLHGKLACVAVLLVLSHLEMFNARRIVKVRSARGDGAAEEIAARKARHATFGLFGTLAVVILVGLVAYGTG
jgi:protoporphyrinogen IX oxidase